MEFLGCVIDAKYASAQRPFLEVFKGITNQPIIMTVSRFWSSSRSPSSEMIEISALASYDCRMNYTPPKDRRGWQRGNE